MTSIPPEDIELMPLSNESTPKTNRPGKAESEERLLIPKADLPQSISCLFAEGIRGLVVMFLMPAGGLRAKLVPRHATAIAHEGQESRLFSRRQVPIPAAVMVVIEKAKTEARLRLPEIEISANNYVGGRFR